MLAKLQLPLPTESEENPWKATTLEWACPSPPPHGNFAVVPTVYRDPYEYSLPGHKTDFLPQDQKLPVEAA